MWVLLAPVLALFEPGFYVRAARAPLTQGIAYLVYLALLTSIGVGLMLSARWLPALDELVEWVGNRLPPITFTVDGPVLAAPRPFVLEHPTYGRLLRVDPTSDQPNSDVPSVVEITRSQVVLARPLAGNGREYRAWDVVPRTEEARQAWSNVTVDGARVEETYRTVRQFAWMAVPLALMLTLVWKLAMALFYSVLAIAMSATLGGRLPYASLLNISIFALTPATLLGWMSAVGLIEPAGIEWPLSPMLTGAYLFIGIRAAARTFPPAKAAG